MCGACAGETDLPRDIKQREWKPAGQVADFRSAACLFSLRRLAQSNFANLGGCWVSALMQESHLFMDVGTGKYFLSLGHVRGVTLAWAMTEVAATKPNLEIGCAGKSACVCGVSLDS